MLKFGKYTAWVLVWTATGCAPTRPLAENEYYLASQRFEGNFSIATENLVPLLRQRPNSFVGKSRIAPYVAAYFLGKSRFVRDSLRYKRKSIKVEAVMKKRQDALLARLQKIKSTGVEGSAKLNRDTLRVLEALREVRSIRAEKIESYQRRLEEGNWLMTSVGEKPVFYDSMQAVSSAIQIKRYYANQGFYQASVTVKTDTLPKRRINVIYKISEAPFFIIKGFDYQIADTALRKVVLADTLYRKPKIGQRFSYNLLQAERERITGVLQNKGYFAFRNSYVFFDVDTSHSQRSAYITMVIKNPAPNQNHKIYTIAKTAFYSERGEDSLFATVNGVEFYQDAVRYNVKTLMNKIFILPNSTFNEEDVNQTQKALRDTDMFKFVNIQFDTLGDKLNANIFTSPFKKYEYSIETGLNVTQALPGPFVRFSLKDRNVFGRLDLLELSLRGGLESQAAASFVQTREGLLGRYLSTELGSGVILSFPRIIFPLGFALKQKLNRRTPQTSFSLNYAFIARPEYVRQNTIAGLKYRWITPQKKHQFYITPLEVVLVNTTRISDLFNNRLLELYNQGNPLIFSFSRSLISSIILEFVNPYSQTGITTRGKFLKFEAESGGTYLNLFAKQLQADNENIGGLRVYRFLRGAVDLRYAKPLSDKSQLVIRLHAGAIYAYSPSGALPYEKYFFVGGSNSNRAWPPRRIGPGSYRPEVNRSGYFDYSFEQPGEIIGEANLEYRSKLFSFIHFAAFADAANVWLFREDASRPGGQFKPENLLRELAVGVGLGLRLDFSFLLVRFDLGIKAYDPARPEQNRFILDNLSLQRPLGERGQSIFNLGIGYPF